MVNLKLNHSIQTFVLLWTELCTFTTVLIMSFTSCKLTVLKISWLVLIFFHKKTLLLALKDPKMLTIIFCVLLQVKIIQLKSKQNIIMVYSCV